MMLHTLCDLRYISVIAFLTQEDCSNIDPFNHEDCNNHYALGHEDCNNHYALDQKEIIHKGLNIFMISSWCSN